MSFKVLLNVAVLAALHGTDPADDVFVSATVLTPNLRGNAILEEDRNHFFSDIDQHQRDLQVTEPPTETFAPTGRPTQTFSPTTSATSSSSLTGTGTIGEDDEPSEDLGTPGPTITPSAPPKPDDPVTPPDNPVDEDPVTPELTKAPTKTPTKAPTSAPGTPQDTRAPTKSPTVAPDVVAVDEEVEDEEVEDEEVEDEQVEDEQVEDEQVEDEQVEDEQVEDEQVEDEQVEEEEPAPADAPTAGPIVMTPRPTFRFNPFAISNPLNNGGNIRAQVQTVVSRMQRPMYNLQSAIDRANRNQNAGFFRMSDEEMPEAKTILV